MHAHEPSGVGRLAVLQARSVSRSVMEVLDQASFSGRIVAVHDRACTVRFPDGNFVSLVLSEIGDGPLNVVLEGTPRDLAALQPGQEARVEGLRLEIGDVVVSLDGAGIWEPCPEWEHLRTNRETIIQHLARLEALALGLAPEGSLLVLIARSSQAIPAGSSSDSLAVDLGPDRLHEAHHFAASEAALGLRAGWEREPAQLQVAVEGLVGLGEGLTPAGDDFLTGVMLWAWLAHPDPLRYCEVVLEAAGSRTTALSQAFLQAVAAGECSATWHRMLTVLTGGTEQQLAAAVQGVLSYGHTSGADTLAGFLWMGLPMTRSRSATR